MSTNPITMQLTTSFLRSIPCSLFAVGLALGVSAQGTYDSGFNVGTGANTRVTSAVMQNDGLVVIGGNFTTYNGTGIARLARLKRDGTLDAGFTPGTGADNQVNSVALASGGGIYIGGQFLNYDGTARRRIARLNSNGALDAGFVVGTGFNNTVTQVAVQPDGKVICVGDFTSYNGTAINRVARLNTNGSLDAGFTVGTGANFLVTCVAVQSDGKILIGGYFNNYNGSLVVALARLNSNGTLDTGYNFGGSGLNNAVAAISLQPDGKALVGGFFTNYNGTGRNRIMRVNTDGSLDTGFDPGTGANNTVLAFAQQSNGAIIVGGDFTTFSGAARNRHCRVTSIGALDATWTTGANNTVNALCWIPEGRVVVGGLFTNIAATASNRVARLKALCTDDVSMITTTDGAGAETEWEIVPVGYTYAAYKGTGLPNNSIFSSNACLADGCYELRVTDSGSNGITGGGYVLKSQNGERIIDNEGNFGTGALSTISGGQGGPVNFCVPIGTFKPIYVGRDKLDWVNNEYLVASENAAVSAVWTGFGSGSPERATSGYDFWFYDPNGNYSFVRQRRHSSSDGFSPANATRACHMKINNWSPANQIPANTLMNVRIRTVVIGAASAWGPAYQFKIDPVRASCPLTKLMDIPSNPYLSCGQTRTWGPGNYVHARPVAGANKYQFRFQIPAEGYNVSRNSNNYFLQLNWATLPLECGKIYEVDVRASFDGGATWCSDFVPPALDPWGDVCLLTIANCLQGGNERMALTDAEEPLTEEPADLFLWPSPGSGDLLNLRITGIDPNAGQLDLAVIDALGRIVHQETVANSATNWTGSLGFERALPAGTYVVQLRAGERVQRERWVVQQ